MYGVYYILPRFNVIFDIYIAGAASTSHWAAMLLLGAASLSSFAGYGLAHLHKFAPPYIDLDIYFVNCGRIYCNLEVYIAIWTYILRWNI